MRFSLVVPALIAALGLGGCVREVKQVEQRPVLTMDQNTAVEPIRFGRMVVDIRRGTPVGSFAPPLGRCGFGPDKVTWGSGRLAMDSVEVGDLFYNEMLAAGYEVVGDPKKLFNTGDEDNKATYVVGGRLTELDMSLCNAINFWWGYSMGVDGQGYVKVAWQVLDKIDRKVVFETTTEGSFKSEDPVPDGQMVILNGAIANAVANLAADQGFNALVRKAPGAGLRATTPAASQAGPMMRIRNNPPPYKAPIGGQMDKVRAAAVTILSDGGHGSGFFVSKDGLILTNYHVVGATRLVKVRLATGREVLGEVMRRDKLRDVALVMVEEQGYDAIPIRTSPVTVGEDVYAIGTPQDEKLSNTVSKGIVSAIRKDKDSGLEHIQADVSIHGGNSGGPLVDGRGNLVGISQSGIMANDAKMGVGLNFFVPITDALDKLNLRLDDENRRM